MSWLSGVKVITNRRHLPSPLTDADDLGKAPADQHAEKVTGLTLTFTGYSAADTPDLKAIIDGQEHTPAADGTFSITVPEPGGDLAVTLTGLPDEAGTQDVEGYSARLRLDYVAPPSVGLAVGGTYGTQVGGGVGFFFSDMLGNRNLAIIAQANGTFKDIGGQVYYLNRGKRFNYGGAIGHIPLLFGGPIAGFTSNGNYVVQDRRFRIFLDQALLIGSYPGVAWAHRRCRPLTESTGLATDYSLLAFEHIYPSGWRCHPLSK